MRARPSLLIVLLSLLTLGLALGCAGKTQPGATPPGGDVAGVPVLDIDGRSATLSSALGGRPGLVSLWAPWCEPCVRELPELERLWRAVAPCGGAVVGVAVGEKPAAIAIYARLRGLTYPQLTDEPFTLADALGQRRIPATVIFDRAGRVVFTGEAVDARARQALLAVIDRPDAAKPCALP